MLFLGNDLLPYLALALGGALFAGNALALIKPPKRTDGDGELGRAPFGRTALYALLGLIVAIWALASLLSN